MGKRKINDLIFRELIKRGYSLEGKTRVWDIADSKLWYLTPKQAQAYLDLLDSESYQSEFGPKELVLIKNNINKILDEIGTDPLNVVDLGCGDGRKAVLFLEKLSARRQKARYCPIDISGYMVEKAIKKISKLKVNEVVDSHWNISDFENLENITPLLTKGEYKKNLFLLLGNTLGNFEINDLLYCIRNSMRTGDYLLVGNGLNNGAVREDVVEFLRKNKKNNEFLIQIPLQLGFNRKDVSLDIQFVNSRIEFSYIVKNRRKVEFQGKKVYFELGDKIIVAVSYHYPKEEFLRFLEIYFDSVEPFLANDESYIVALCKK